MRNCVLDNLARYVYTASMKSKSYLNYHNHTFIIIHLSTRGGRNYSIYVKPYI